MTKNTTIMDAAAAIDKEQPTATPTAHNNDDQSADDKVVFREITINQTSSTTKEGEFAPNTMDPSPTASSTSCTSNDNAETTTAGGTAVSTIEFSGDNNELTTTTALQENIQPFTATAPETSATTPEDEETDILVATKPDETSTMVVEQSTHEEQDIEVTIRSTLDDDNAEDRSNQNVEEEPASEEKEEPASEEKETLSIAPNEVETMVDTVSHQNMAEKPAHATEKQDSTEEQVPSFAANDVENVATTADAASHKHVEVELVAAEEGAPSETVDIQADTASHENDAEEPLVEDKEAPTYNAATMTSENEELNENRAVDDGMVNGLPQVVDTPEEVECSDERAEALENQKSKDHKVEDHEVATTSEEIAGDAEMDEAKGIAADEQAEVPSPSGSFDVTTAAGVKQQDKLLEESKQLAVEQAGDLEKEKVQESEISTISEQEILPPTSSSEERSGFNKYNVQEIEVPTVPEQEALSTTATSFEEQTDLNEDKVQESEVPTVPEQEALSTTASFEERSGFNKNNVQESEVATVPEQEALSTTATSSEEQTDLNEDKVQENNGAGVEQQETDAPGSVEAIGDEEVLGTHTEIEASDVDDATPPPTVESSPKCTSAAECLEGDCLEKIAENAELAKAMKEPLPPVKASVQVVVESEIDVVLDLAPPKIEEEKKEDFESPVPPPKEVGVNMDAPATKSFGEVTVREIDSNGQHEIELQSTEVSVKENVSLADCLLDEDENIEEHDLLVPQEAGEPTMESTSSPNANATDEETKKRSLPSSQQVERTTNKAPEEELCSSNVAEEVDDNKQAAKTTLLTVASGDSKGKDAVTVPVTASTEEDVLIRNATSQESVGRQRQREILNTLKKAGAHIKVEVGSPSGNAALTTISSLRQDDATKLKAAVQIQKKNTLSTIENQSSFGERYKNGLIAGLSLETASSTFRVKNQVAAINQRCASSTSKPVVSNLESKEQRQHDVKERKRRASTGVMVQSKVQSIVTAKTPTAVLSIKSPTVSPGMNTRNLLKIYNKDLYYCNEFSYLIDVDPADTEKSEKMDWQAITTIIQECPAVTRTKYDLTFEGEKRHLFPLFSLVANGAPVDLIRVVFFENPFRFLEERDKCGQTLMHYACAFNPLSIKAFAFLIHRSAHSLDAFDSHSRTPLHVACANTKIDPEVVQFILKESPLEVVGVPDCDGNLPLDLALRNPQCSPELRKSLMNRSEERDEEARQQASKERQQEDFVDPCDIAPAATSSFDKHAVETKNSSPTNDRRLPDMEIPNPSFWERLCCRPVI